MCTKKRAFALAEGATHVDKPPVFAKAGFTLAEVLITLGIIGVVAAMTVPNLMTKIQEIRTVARLKQVQSVFSQALLYAEDEFGPVDSWEIGREDSQDGALKLYENFKPFLKLGLDCGVDKKGCFPDVKYKALFAPVHFGWGGEWTPENSTAYARGMLLSGVSFAMWSGGEGCNSNSSAGGNSGYTHSCGAIHVDLTGTGGPNRAGVDYFTFVITTKGIYPAGLKDYRSKYGDSCIYKSNLATNGNACTGWVLEKGNMDYLRRPISW